jgi:hypothetical protein
MSGDPGEKEGRASVWYSVISVEILGLPDRNCSSLFPSQNCRNISDISFFLFFLLLLLYWGYIVTFTKVLTTYHN